MFVEVHLEEAEQALWKSPTLEVHRTLQAYSKESQSRVLSLGETLVHFARAMLTTFPFP